MPSSRLLISSLPGKALRTLISKDICPVFFVYYYIKDTDEVKSSDAVRVLSRKRKKEHDHEDVTRKRNKCQDYVKEGTRKRTQDQEATCLKSKVPRHDEKETKRVEKGPSKAGSIEHRHDSSKPGKVSSSSICV